MAQVAPSCPPNAKTAADPGDHYTGQGEVAAVFDSGIDQTHGDFAGRIKAAVPCKCCATDDQIGHGTNVAGIVAGSSKVSGGKIRGMAPDCQLLVFGIADGNGRLVTSPDIGELLSSPSTYTI